MEHSTKLPVFFCSRILFLLHSRYSSAPEYYSCYTPGVLLVQNITPATLPVFFRSRILFLIHSRYSSIPEYFSCYTPSILLLQNIIPATLPVFFCSRILLRKCGGNQLTKVFPKRCVAGVLFCTRRTPGV